MKKIYLLLVLCCIGYSGFAQVTVIAATGGTAICGPTPACTTLGDITISENTFADFSSGSDQLVLVPPAGWQFCTGTAPTLNFASGGDITAVTSGGFTATSLTVNIACGGTSGPDEVTISGLQVQPLAPTSVPGSITASSVTGIYDIMTGTTDFGDLALFPGFIAGANAVCSGGTTTLSDAATGGTWTSSDAAVATIDPASGAVTALAGTGGTTVITYSVSPGCSTSVTFSVVPTPLGITGPDVVCAGGSFIRLSDGTTGGTWSSGTTTVATVTAAGVVVGVGAGTTVITYQTSPLVSCASATVTVSVTGIPAAMTPSAVVCTGSGITLSDATAGGTWSTGISSVVTVGSGTGVVTGEAAGTAIITYSTGCGAAATTTVYVNTSPGPITGPTSLCSGGVTINLSDNIAGGSWTSSNSSVATIDPALGTVTSTLPGATIISYLTTCTTVTTTVNVLTIPGSIFGSTELCQGATRTFSDAATGGTWSSSVTTVATIDSVLGTVSGVAAGTTNLTYSTGCGSPSFTLITVISSPTVITGPTSLCSGGVIITLSDAVAGGTWSSSVTSVATIDPAAGTVTSTLSGATVITYSTGCGADATATVTVLTIPGTITGPTSSVCVGANITLSDATTGGTWSTANTALATVDSAAGIVYGVSGGAINVTYSTGCGSPAVVSGTVHPLPGPILGGLTVCSGGSTISLSDATPGGSWSSSETAVATISGTLGIVVSGIVGTTTISYTTLCGSSTATVVVAGTTLSAISPATTSVCAGSTVTLSDATAGGTWSSSSSSLATVDPTTGIVTGVAAGSVPITYATGCGAAVTATVTVVSAPGPITGLLSVCSSGSILALSDATLGGAWSSGTTTVATIGSASGVITSGVMGATTITYSTGCGTATTATVTVIGIPVAILPASSNLCSGGSGETLSDDGVAGGIWSSATSTVATIGSATGHVISGVVGTTVISYNTGCGAAVSATVTVISAPAAISPLSATICSGATITLSDATTGGTWSTSLSAVATVDPALGIVSGSAAGTAVISYAIGCGTAATRTVTVTGIPAAITPATATICPGTTINLSDVTAGGIWSSGTSAVATVGSVSGLVTGGITPGTTIISYSTGCGTAATRTVTVNGTTTPILGVFTVCSGGLTITLSDATAGGTWSTSTSAVATIGSVTGIVTSGIVGISTISYSTGCGTAATRTVTVLGTPTAISPVAPTTVCAGATVTLSDAVTGGTWSSSNTAIATVGSVTGIVTGGAVVNTLNSVITYSTGCGASVTTTVTVMGVPDAIAGAPLSVCSGGSTITLTDAVGGGIWSTSTSAVATVGAVSGVVTGGIVGTTTITYSTGCAPDATVTVNVLGVPAAISPVSASICSGANITLSDAVTGGTWSSSTSAVATVDAVTGKVTGGVTPGTSTITYSTGCGANATIIATVTGIPGAISGKLSVCSGGSNITLSDAVAGGTWSTNNSAVAVIGSATGIVTSGIVGTTTITYATSCASSSVTVTVLGTPVALNPTFALCTTGTATLTDATTGGTWSTSTSTVATIGSATGFVTGGAAGNATITYSTGCGASTTTTITVIGVPVAIAPASANICAPGNVTLSDATAGGTWTSSITTTATIGSLTGFVTGVAVGQTIISYSTGCGAIATSTVNVLGVPVAISPAVASVCSGSNITLSDATTGGTWASGTTTVATVGAATGIVTGAGTGGTSLITYSTGCGTAMTRSVTVIGIPGGISGLLKVCSGGSNITLSDAVAGGTWSTNNSAVAVIGSATGIVTSGIVGTTTITYATSCASSSVTVTVLGTPVVLNPTFALCTTGTATLTDATTGGTWSTSTSTVATIGSATGFVTGGAAGNATITYSTGCGASTTTTITVIGVPGAISPATANICAAGNVTLSDATVNGTWTSNNTATASIISTTGIVTGVATGTAIISYSTGCGAIATSTVNVLGVPDPIAGLSGVCAGGNITLSDDIVGGTWSSGTSAVATVSAATGIVTGATGGTTTITYSTGCGAAATTTVAVTAIPGAISGTLSVCFGGSGTTTLSNTNSGGVWSSDNTTIATVGSATGIVTGGIPGTATISYATGCGIASATVTVSSSPSAITGNSFVCSGSAVTLSDGSTGGAWSSDNTAVATIDPSLGTVTGGTAGTATITYFTGCGAGAVLSFTVNPLPAVPSAILGSAVVCTGSSVTLSDATTGGVWSSGNTALGTISASGTLSALTTGTVTINYTVSNTCGSNSVSSAIAVDVPVSTPSPIIGATTVCEGATIPLSDSTALGVWSSGNTAITVSISGVCYGVAGGSSVISYTVSNACSSASSIESITVMSLPSPDSISGYVDTLCAGSTVTLSDATPGGVWSSELTTIAVVSSSGVVTAVSGSNATIFYSVTNSCGTVAADVIITVAALPPIGAITGPANVCAGHTISLSDVTTGGVWSSSAAGIAAVGSTGTVTANAEGMAIISYTTSYTCGIEHATTVVIVSGPPVVGPITGSDYVCVGYTTALSDSVAGGVWSCYPLVTAIISSSGVLTGIGAGSDLVSYTVTNSCGVATATRSVTILEPTASGCEPPAGVNTVSAIPMELKVFPNPNAGTFTLNLQSAANEPVQVIITSMTGEKVKELTTITNTDTPIQLNAAAGIYFISTVTTEGKQMVKVVVDR